MTTVSVTSTSTAIAEHEHDASPGLKTSSGGGSVEICFMDNQSPRHLLSTLAALNYPVPFGTGRGYTGPIGTGKLAFNKDCDGPGKL